jgi:ABC-2 type transport system ATP-binding protein
MIEASGLVKWYGPTRAIENLSFHIPAGQIVGFLGPNGAGKSTTLRILTGYLPPTAGTASIAGHDVLREDQAARSKTGYLPEATPLYHEMRVEEYLDYRGRLLSMDRNKRRQRIAVVCDRCGLAHIRRRLIGQLSRGNRQRVGIAQALLHEPPVLILDEPTAGLDPNQIGHVRQLITELRGKHTILLSSHILPEVEKTADRVMIITAGRIVADGSPEELRRKAATGGRLLVEAKADPNLLSQMLQQLPQIQAVKTEARDGWCRAVITPRDKADIRELVGQSMLQRGFPLRELRYESATLEEFFIQITAEPAATQDNSAA